MKSLFAIWLTFSLGTMLVAAAHTPNRTGSNLEDGQPTLSGVDAEYVHGKHCVDTRSF